MAKLISPNRVWLTIRQRKKREKTVAQGNAPLDDDGRFIRTQVKSRYGSDFPCGTSSRCGFNGRSLTQIASIAASLIPFLEHDDAN